MVKQGQSFDYRLLETLRQDHPAWRLLRANHAPLIGSFLHRVFIVPNVRTITQAELVEALEDELFHLREVLGDEHFPGTADRYLDEWADNEKGWLRKFYPAGTDEPHFDLTSATVKALTWLESLMDRAFVGTESRLLTLFDLLRQMSEGSQADPELRLAELQKRRDEIDAEIAQVREGKVALLDNTALLDRFQQFLWIARELLGDFREVEGNFRALDRQVRERIALWDGAKGELLEEIMGERDAIADSDQGKSFRAFWDFLMSPSRQEELTRLLDEVLELPPIRDTEPDMRLRRVHYEWLEAGEYTQRTVARLSGQLRRFLDDKAWLENRRIMDILRNIEGHALALREERFPRTFMEMDEAGVKVGLPMERPLYSPSVRTLISGVALDEGDAVVDTAALYNQHAVDRVELQGHIRRELQRCKYVTLGEVITRYPLRHGLAELVAYLQVDSACSVVVDENDQEQVKWQTEEGNIRRATLPRIVFERT